MIYFYIFQDFYNLQNCEVMNAKILAA